METMYLAVIECMRYQVSALLVKQFFFFQAEDGIRDLTVTGVQTCALPILHALFPVVHPAVPVPQGAVRGRRPAGTVVRVLELRQSAGGPAPGRHVESGCLAALAGGARETHRYAADRCQRDHRVLSAADAVADRAESGTAVRVV